MHSTAKWVCEGNLEYDRLAIRISDFCELEALSVPFILTSSTLSAEAGGI